ncbi:MAG TPA: DinB family protein [Longimicrobium sp.]|jgi:uncharacterized damage-inducible protein DinB
MSVLLSLMDHAAWADTRARAAIEHLPDGDERARAVRLYAHLAAAEHVWLSRLEGRTPVHPVWPDLSLADAAALAADSIAAFRRVAEGAQDELARVVEYRNSAGLSFQNTVAEILTHVALHGSYHRGQIAALTRAGGGTPAATDYIMFARDGEVPR